MGNPQREVCTDIPATVAHWELMHCTTSYCLKQNAATRPHTGLSFTWTSTAMSFFHLSLPHIYTDIHTACPVRFLLTWCNTLRMCVCVCAQRDRSQHTAVSSSWEVNSMQIFSQAICGEVTFTRDTVCVCLFCSVRGHPDCCVTATGEKIWCNLWSISLCNLFRLQSHF